MKDLIVVGGGIGGLAAALAAVRPGRKVAVLERRDVYGELGAGIQLGPNAFHALDRLGVGMAVRARAVRVDALRFMNGTSDTAVASMPLTGAYVRRFRNPYAVVHRVDLHRPLLDACREAGVDLRVNSGLVRYEQEAGSVTAVLDDGQRVTGRALIGADGIRSAVRAQLLDDGEPRVSGHTIYRSVVPMEAVPPQLRRNVVTLWAGPKWHFVHYPIAAGEFLNMAITRDDGAREAVAGVPVSEERVLSEFPGLGPCARGLLELGRDWRTWVLCDRDPVTTWTDARVALLGDAAHPMLQYAAQGACQALEDAVVLGELLGGAACEDVPQLLEKYAAARRERTARAQRVAREMGERLYHPEGRAARERDTMLGSLSADEMYDAVQWLHGERNFAAPGRG
ncbi:FAD-dependent monooxygenase [Streptomyces sp. NPDC021969]|uniref:FAD-dependent monooxygenase n=1 Tax=unclassified Streptomyces TaxID=2593676 RepID=UPI0033DD0A5B